MADTTVQLRRYRLAPGARESFLAFWRDTVMPVRRDHGFDLVFAYLIPETDEFVWAVSHGGDATAFAEADRAYQESPDRRAAFQDQPRRVVEQLVHLVEPARSP